MYCIKCGVELSDSEAKCPLCGLKPYHPDLVRADAESPYPDTVAKPVRSLKRVSMMLMVSWFTAIVLFTLMLVDFSLNHDMVWSKYVLISIMLFYVIFIFPMWFKKKNDVIFISVDIAALTLFLALICMFTGGKWFFTLALPIMIVVACISVPIVALVHYVKKGYLYITGAGFIALGIAMVLVEIFVNITFQVRSHLAWSYIPLIILVLTGLFFIVVAIVKPFREALSKIFFI